MLKSEIIAMILDLEKPNSPLALEIRTKHWNKQTKDICLARLDYVTAPVGTEARAAALKVYQAATEGALQKQARAGDRRAEGPRRRTFPAYR